MNRVVIGRRKFSGPASWDEITPRRFLQFLNWRIRLGSDPSGKWALLQLWYRIRYRDLRLLDDAQRSEVLSLLGFLDERPERWILPKVMLNYRSYIGPGDGLDYLTFAEFMRAQAARDAFYATGMAIHLGELVAALYRPRAFFFQTAGEAKRQLFDIRSYDDQAQRMCKLPASMQQGILMNYEGCLDKFPAQFKYLFNAPEGGSEGGTWLDVGLSLARQTNALGTFVQLEQSNLFLVLSTLDALMKEQAEMEEKLKKNGQS